MMNAPKISHETTAAGLTSSPTTRHSPTTNSMTGSAQPTVGTTVSGNSW